MQQIGEIYIFYAKRHKRIVRTADFNRIVTLMPRVLSSWLSVNLCTSYMFETIVHTQAQHIKYDETQNTLIAIPQSPTVVTAVTVAAAARNKTQNR